MNEHLLKAKKALEDASNVEVDLSQGTPLSPLYGRLLDLAHVQAELAVAESLDKLCELLTPHPWGGGPR